jgi:hypothetical protein
MNFRTVVIQLAQKPTSEQILECQSIHTNLPAIFKVLLIDRLNRKHMRRPRLMKSERINKYKKCLLSGVISNALAYFLNPLYLGPKNPIQFAVIDTH